MFKDNEGISSLFVVLLVPHDSNLKLTKFLRGQYSFNRPVGAKGALKIVFSRII